MLTLHCLYNCVLCMLGLPNVSYPVCPYAASPFLTHTMPHAFLALYTYLHVCTYIHAT